MQKVKGRLVAVDWAVSKVAFELGPLDALEGRVCHASMLMGQHQSLYGSSHHYIAPPLGSQWPFLGFAYPVSAF